MSALALVAALVVVLAITATVALAVRVVTCLEVRQHRREDRALLVDERVLRPVAKRLTWGK